GDIKMAMSLNSRLRVLCGAGLYDLTCPYFGQAYGVAHLGVDPEVQERLKFVRYPAGRWPG
ncbi:MAG: peptidase S10, partial [Candidatus Hydrogenedentes bacterium]|nr:peptidase S10 [Candidatus Hydrogenedentota bacterium]